MKEYKYNINGNDYEVTVEGIKKTDLTSCSSKACWCSSTCYS